MRRSNQLVVRQREPENLESPCSALGSYITPNELFYVRNHFPMPRIELGSWRLKVEGAVEKAREFTYEELLEMPSFTVTAALECAGNGRTFLPEKSKGVQWHLGAVGNADWTGVPLTSVFEKVGLKPEATQVVLEGADSCTIKEQPRTPDAIHFARSLPLKKALSPYVLLAHSMNGTRLPERHGFPIRAVAPGWYGMASTKWLKRIVVCDRTVSGYFESFEYSHWVEHRGLCVLAPLNAIQIKAQIVRPAVDEVVNSNKTYAVSGLAWTGEAEIDTVEVSVDGGQSWNLAQIIDTPRRYSWVRWRYDWVPPKTSMALTLMARAKDTEGNTQPSEHRPEERHYSVHHVLSVPVRVA